MEEQTTPLHILALGPPEVRLGKTLVSFPTRKTLALLIYLAIEPSLQPREHLAALLWPEASSERSHANLRNTLGHLQTALRLANSQDHAPFLTVSNQSLGLNPDADIDFDLSTIERAYASARSDRSNRLLPDGSASLPLLQSAAAFQRGDFLAGFSLGDASGFDDWAAVQREVWHRRMGLILDRLSEIQFAAGRVFWRYGDCLALDCAGWVERNCLSSENAGALRGRRARSSPGDLRGLPGCFRVGIRGRTRAGYSRSGRAHPHPSFPCTSHRQPHCVSTAPARYIGCFSGKAVYRT